MNLNYKPDWSRISTSTGYEVVYCPDHPRAWSTGYVYVHTIVAENKIGRLLRGGEVVHHLNENRRDNRPENITVTNQSVHAATHRKEAGEKRVKLKCPNCSTVFDRPRRKTFIVKGGTWTACSPKCRGAFSRRVQLYGLLDSDKRAISENVIEEYISPDSSTG